MTPTPRPSTRTPTTRTATTRTSTTRTDSRSRAAAGRQAASRRAGSGRPGSGRTRRRAQERRHRVVAALGALILIVTLLMVVDRLRTPGYGGPATCTFTGADGVVFDLAPEQARNAAVIAAATTRRGLPPRAAVVGIATALQESKLRNLPGGDRDSLGLFQQRPSQGWGTRAQILDPVYASDKFYESLVEVDGWQELPLTRAAQAVQRSGFPEAYAVHETEATLYGDALAGVRPEAVGCRLDEPSAGLGADEVRERLHRETGLRAEPAGDGLVLQAADRRSAATAAAWAVASAHELGVTQVSLGDRIWRRSPATEALTWSSSTAGARETAVRISLARP